MSQPALRADWTGDEFAINKYLVAVKGSLSNPVIDRVYSINLDTDQKIETIMDVIYEDEAKFGAYAFSTIKSSDKDNVVECWTRQDTPDYYQYAKEFTERRKGSQSRTSAETSGGRGNRGRGTESGRTFDEKEIKYKQPLMKLITSAAVFVLVNLQASRSTLRASAVFVSAPNKNNPSA